MCDLHKHSKAYGRGPGLWEMTTMIQQSGPPKDAPPQRWDSPCITVGDNPPDPTNLERTLRTRDFHFAQRAQISLSTWNSAQTERSTWRFTGSVRAFSQPAENALALMRFGLRARASNSWLNHLCLVSLFSVPHGMMTHIRFATLQPAFMLYATCGQANRQCRTGQNHGDNVGFLPQCSCLLSQLGQP